MYKDGRKIDILFFVEHKDRELEVICSIAQLLQTRYKLSIAVASSIFHPVFAALLIRPKIVVTTGIAPTRSIGEGPEYILTIFQSIYRKRIKYVSMNWEQILSPINVNYRAPRDDFTKLFVKHFSWGSAFKEFLVTHGVAENNIYITGKPSLSLLMRKSFSERDALKKELAKKSGLNVDIKWLFFPMTCHMAFFNEYHLRSRVGVGSDVSRVKEHAAYVNRSLNHIFKWLATLDRTVDTRAFKIILRPHPAVSVSQYKERFHRVIGYIPDWVHISKDFSAHDWLAVCDACYTNYSSLSLDANAIGKPAYLLEPEPYPSFLLVDWFVGMDRIRNLTELVRSFGKGDHRESKVKGLQNHTDLKLQGIEMTAAYLGQFADEANWASWSLFGFLKGVNRRRRRALGSILRLTAASLNFLQAVRPGLRPDFFSASDVEKLLLNARLRCENSE